MITYDLLCQDQHGTRLVVVICAFSIQGNLPPASLHTGPFLVGGKSIFSFITVGKGGSGPRIFAEFTRDR